MGWVVNTTPWLLCGWEGDAVLLDKRLGGPQGRSGQVHKILPPLGFDPWTIQTIISFYAPSVIQAHLKIKSVLYCLPIFVLRPKHLHPETIPTKIFLVFLVTAFQLNVCPI
jgi:hypothetical protein